MIIEPRSSGDKRGFVYVHAMLIPSEPVFKIGKAICVNARLQSMTSLPYPEVTVFAIWFQDALAQEAYIHRHFAEYRLRGEWFALPDDALLELHELAERMRPKTPEWLRDQLVALPMEIWHKHKYDLWPKRSEEVA